ncbi:MAG: 1-acyl-sn-glycerol-3-phosphate acyltransferase [Alphaproteobacteria bacterium]|nr:1-acyl-sn-glycerol-3-phosphate acyltransferase [Alphaproteobacteria bacterium]
MPRPSQIARALTRVLSAGTSRTIGERLSFADEGHGYDAFGMHPDFVALGESIGALMHDHWFRVVSYDHHHIPTTGPAILAANHSGTLPFDGMMVWTDVVQHTDPPRAPRPIADYFVSSLPFIGTLFQRSGMVGGSRGNVRRLLEQGELLLLFPEGTPGIGKPWSERYQLQDWRKGHVEFAIRYQAPVVPVGVVGAEEQMPQLARIPIRQLGLSVPYLPIPATPIPLPTRYHILYGEPIRFDREYRPTDADNPEIVREAALRVKTAVQELLHRGLRQRKGVFR